MPKRITNDLAVVFWQPSQMASSHISSFQMPKLSPQPHWFFTFGLLNLNPSFKPSRV